MKNYSQKTLKNINILFTFIVPTLFSACSNLDNDWSESSSSQKDIIEFSLPSVPATGIISENAIRVRVPPLTDISDLVAHFSTTGKSVKIGSSAQVSNSTRNNFSSPLIYTVTAEDGSTQDYSVNVVFAGTAVGWIGGGFTGWQQGTSAASGTGYQYFANNNVGNVCVDSNGDIYIADTPNNRICKWDKYGTALGWIGGGSNGWKTSAAPASGYALNSFNQPYGVYIDKSDLIYVVDTGNRRICKWDKDGNAIGWIGGGSNGWHATDGTASSGTGYQFFSIPRNCVLDDEGNIYIADTQNNRICKWDKAGIALGWIGGGNNGWQTGSAPAAGSSDKSFSMPRYVLLDQEGSIYVSDTLNHRVSKWDKSGTVIGWIGGGYTGWQTGTGAATGNGYDYIVNAYGIAMDQDGTIFICDTGLNRVSKWSKDGIALGWIGGGNDGWQTTSGNTSGSDYRSFTDPHSIFADNNGYIYIFDLVNRRVCKWIN